MEKINLILSILVLVTFSRVFKAVKSDMGDEKNVFLLKFYL